MDRYATVSDLLAALVPLATEFAADSRKSLPTPLHLRLHLRSGDIYVGALQSVADRRLSIADRATGLRRDVSASELRSVYREVSNRTLRWAAISLATAIGLGSIGWLFWLLAHPGWDLRLLWRLLFVAPVLLVMLLVYQFDRDRGTGRRFSTWALIYRARDA